MFYEFYQLITGSVEKSISDLQALNSKRYSQANLPAMHMIVIQVRLTDRVFYLIGYTLFSKLKFILLSL